MNGPGDEGLPLLPRRNREVCICLVDEPCRTFLVLDDSADDRFLTAYTLRRSFPGCRIIESETVAEALHAANGVTLDGVITDHHLAEEDGVAFISRIRALGLHCPVVMLTMSSDPQVHRRAHAAGADRVFNASASDFAAYFRQVLFPSA